LRHAERLSRDAQRHALTTPVETLASTSALCFNLFGTLGEGREGQEAKPVSLLLFHSRPCALAEPFPRDYRKLS
jgi:hypothetical protein